MKCLSVFELCGSGDPIQLKQFWENGTQCAPIRGICCLKLNKDLQMLPWPGFKWKWTEGTVQFVGLDQNGSECVQQDTGRTYWPNHSVGIWFILKENGFAKGEATHCQSSIQISSFTRKNTAFLVLNSPMTALPGIFHPFTFYKNVGLFHSPCWGQIMICIFHSFDHFCHMNI
jgi:hypothetical protein